MTATHNATQPSFAKSGPGRIGHKVPGSDVPATEPTSVLKRHLLREQPARLPEVSEPEVVRHDVTLSTRNHHIDKDIYPLGSCTRKYKHKINYAVAELPGFAQLHP